MRSSRSVSRFTSSVNGTATRGYCTAQCSSGYIWTAAPARDRDIMEGGAAQTPEEGRVGAEPSRRAGSQEPQEGKLPHLLTPGEWDAALLGTGAKSGGAPHPHNTPDPHRLPPQGSRPQAAPLMSPRRPASPASAHPHS